MPVTPKLNRVIHRVSTAVTTPAGVSGDQPTEKRPPSHRGPHPLTGERHRL